MEWGEWHDYLYVLNLMLKVVGLADREWSPAEILLSTKAMQHRFEAIEKLGSTGRLEQDKTGFFIPASMLALPVSIKPGAGDDIDIDAVNLWSSAPPKSYTASLEKMIRSYSKDRWLHIEQVSELTKSSVRTIQRRLSAEQKTYTGLVEDLRAKMAGDLLQNSDAAIAEIAHHLGYRNQSSFTRAFCRWTVVSPSEFRKKRSLTD